MQTAQARQKPPQEQAQDKSDVLPLLISQCFSGLLLLFFFLPLLFIARVVALQKHSRVLPAVLSAWPWKNVPPKLTPNGKLGFWILVL